MHLSFPFLIKMDSIYIKKLIDVNVFLTLAYIEL